MNLRQLKAFQEVMLTGSVSKAARNIGRTQPAISSLITGLEGAVGYKLFERRAGRLHPVPEAHFLLENASNILKQVNSLNQTMQSVGTLETGQLRISCLPVFADRLMPELLANFVKDRDHVTVSLISERSNEVYSRLASQQFEIGLAEVAPQSPLVDTYEIEMDCVCAVPSANPLARKSVITPADLDGQAMTSFVPQHFVRQQVASVFEQAGCDFNVRFEIQNAASQYVFIEEGLACGVMSPISAQNYLATRGDMGRITFIPFLPRVPYKIAIIRPAHRPLSRLAQAFSDLLQDEIEKIHIGG